MKRQLLYLTFLFCINLYSEDVNFFELSEDYKKIFESGLSPDLLERDAILFLRENLPKADYFIQNKLKEFGSYSYLIFLELISSFEFNNYVKEDLYNLSLENRQKCIKLLYIFQNLCLNYGKMFLILEEGK
jgi:hypothetical protein